MSGPNMPSSFQNLCTHPGEDSSLCLPQFNQFLTQAYNGNTENANVSNIEVPNEGNPLPDFFGFYESILRMSVESCLMAPNPEFWMPFQDPESFFPATESLQLPVEMEENLKPTQFVEEQKKIGLITAEERKLKVQRYLEKRKKRTFKKIVTYECRKRVADSRIRVKGRFITKEQAEMLKSLDVEKALKTE
ncbi:unnamed protein product [Blepharisma stoltei]|uniref:CCT domain-containing protein n=1 Tax=Blepharisma stoltei TaxID=1481888 RepID=A0AAU9IXV9_9CILI|nr:unnamed protein product [Blepharisma stoltei]